MRILFRWLCISWWRALLQHALNKRFIYFNFQLNISPKTFDFKIFRIILQEIPTNPNKPQTNQSTRIIRIYLCKNIFFRDSKFTYCHVHGFHSVPLLHILLLRTNISGSAGRVSSGSFSLDVGHTQHPRSDTTVHIPSCFVHYIDKTPHMYPERMFVGTGMFFLWYYTWIEKGFLIVLEKEYSKS